MSRPAHQLTGLVAYGFGSLLLMSVGLALFERHARSNHQEAGRPGGRPLASDLGAAGLARPPNGAPHTDEGEMVDGRDPRSLVARLAALFEKNTDGEDDDEAARLVTEITELGDEGALLLGERVDALSASSPARDRLLDVLRRTPGRAAESRLIVEARDGRTAASRAMAIKSLGERKTDRAVVALAEIAEHDPELPEHPLIATPRSPSDTSTELPDEVAFTPRMQAMASLAATGGPRAASSLAVVLAGGPDESLRMEAARNLRALRDEPGILDALAGAVAEDASP